MVNENQKNEIIRKTWKWNDILKWKEDRFDHVKIQREYNFLITGKPVFKLNHFMTIAEILKIAEEINNSRRNQFSEEAKKRMKEKADIYIKNKWFCIYYLYFDWPEIIEREITPPHPDPGNLVYHCGGV